MTLNKINKNMINGLPEDLNNLTQQLAQKVTKGEISVLDIDKNKGKIDQTYLSDSLIQQMAGNTPINTVPANNSITKEKLAFTPVDGTPSNNLFNKDTVTTGKYVNSSHGNLSDNVNMFASDFIEVIPNTQYTRSSLDQMATYDENKVFILVTGTTSSRTFTTPANAKYIRVSGLLSNLGTYQVEKGATQTEYEPFNLIKLSKFTAIPGEALQNKTVTPEKLTFKPLIPNAQSRNLFNKATSTDGKYVSSSSGNLNNNTVFSATDYIEVEPSANYVFSERGQMAWYDSNKTYISGNAFGGGSSTLGEGIVASPTGAKFLRSSFLTANKDKFQIKKGEVLGGYEEFGAVYVSQQQIDPLFANTIAASSNSPLKNLRWNVLGDSISDPSFGFKVYAEYIAERTGITVRNYGISGTTIANKQDGSITNAMSTRYVNMDNDADIITVFGGTNDFGAGRPIGTFNDGTDYTFYGGVQTLIKGLLTKYPTKRIGFILPLQRKYVTVPVEHLSVYVGILRECCEYYSIPYLDLYKGAGINPNFEASRLATVPDGLHPNDLGQEVISSKIESFLLSL